MMSLPPRFHRLLLAVAATLLAVPHARAGEEGNQFIITSAETFTASPLRHLPAHNARDSLGTALKLVELDARQRDLLTEHVHEKEGRCGGYFAFSSRSEAEDFLVHERALNSLLAAAPISYTIDNQATVAPWLDQVMEANIRATIAHLSSYHNRYYTSPTGREAAEWIHDTWAALGDEREDVQAELFTNCGGCSTQPSVILTVQGSELPDEVIVVGAHLDSIRSRRMTPAEQALPPAQRHAPGADDDASGIAVITETIRIALASGWKPQRTIKFMGYAAEEVGLVGSAAIAQNFAALGVNVIGVLQLDMTNYRQGVSHDVHFITDNTNPALLAFSYALFDTYLVPRSLIRRSTTCGYACSDHASWTSAGFPAVMASEPGNATHTFYQGLHSADDTLEEVGGTADISVPFAYFALAFIGELAKTQAVPLEAPMFEDGFEPQPEAAPPAR